ncbi:tetratricopeptide repeat protein [Orbus mooreae]|uniref:tetratricopeptide repeat protein n=1 Tax=Orbus mooreae TaxID=3074107 RepID=UPI00370D546E
MFSYDFYLYHRGDICLFFWRGSGCRERGNGSFLLYNSFTDCLITIDKQLERPNHGVVVNNGYFSIEDWHFNNELSGSFYVFDNHGNAIFNKNFSANIINSSLSSTGNLAVCQTANSDNEDGNKLFLFDVQNNKQLFSISPVSWADSYEFDEEKKYLIVNFNDIGKFRYNIQGIFLDIKEFQEARLKSDRYDVIIFTAEEMLKESNLPLEKTRKILDAIIKARKIGADSNQSWKALALKVQGLAYELLSEYSKAIAVYEEALEINPKIGVKRKLAFLKKEIFVK